MKTNYKIIIWLAGAALLVTLGVIVSFWTFKQIEAATEVRKHTYAILDNGNSLLSSLKDAETGMRGYLLTDDETFLQPYLAVRDNISGQLKKLRQLTSISDGDKHLDALTPLVEAKLAYLARNIELQHNHDITAVQANIRSQLGKPLMDSIRAEIDSFIRTEQGVLEQREAEFESNIRNLFTIIITTSLFTLLFALAFAYLFYQETQRRLKNLVLFETQHLLEIQEEMNEKLQQTNLTLQISEEKLTVTLNSIGDAVIATDTEARVTFINPVAEQLTGWTQVEAYGRSVAEIFHIIHQKTRQTVSIPIMDALEHGTIQGLANHTVLIARDGSERDIADSCAPIRDRDNQVAGAVLVFRDVTKEYAVQHALNDNATRIQTILNTVGDSIITFQAHDGIIETINPAVERIFGYTAAELIGQKFSLLIPEFEQDQHTGFLEYYTASDEERAIGLGREVIGQRKDGSIFPLELVVSEMWLGSKRYFTSILRDSTARKQAEEAKLKADALQNAIFNSANFSSIATDAKGVIQIFNVGAERMLGYTAAEVMNKITPADISDPQELITRAEALTVELETPITSGFEALVFKASRGIEDIYELTYIRKDGSRFPAVVSVTALRDDQNGIIGYLLIGTDNTARKLAEEALLKAGALQTAIFNSANFSSIATDAQGVIQIFNVGAERMLGYAAAEVMNKITPADISDPQELITRAEVLTTELETPITSGFEALVFKASRGIEDIYELTYIRKDGSRFPAVVSVTALRDDQNGIIGYLLIGTDNTARKLAEEALLKAGALQTAIFNSANFSSIATDAQGVIQIFNVGAERMLGYAAAEVMNKITPADISDPQELITRAEVLTAELETPITSGFEALVFKASRGIEDIYELTYIRKDGSRFPAVVSVTALRDVKGKIIGYLLIGTDNTARKRVDAERVQLYETLKEKNIELEIATSVAEKANLAKSDFLSRMSHELRTPLNAILGFAQLLEIGSPPPTTTQIVRLHQIIKAGWYLLELINEILDLAVIESGKLSLSRESVSMAEVMHECQAMIESQAEKRGILMTFFPCDSTWFANGDRTRIKQIIINLLSNAIKYNREQGTVEVKCTCTPERICISIKDSGKGLPPEKLAQLFQPFNRLGQESGSEEGTGIGLVVTKQLVELMGGNISVNSTVGVGSEFCIELIRDVTPQLDASTIIPTELLQPAQKNSTLRTLLYVEDNPANLMLVEQIIEAHPQVRMLSARDGYQGLELARTHLPDVILMDINLPGISGIQTMNILSKDPTTMHIPVIALSANAMLRDIEKGLESGFFRYLTKPIKINEFMNALDDALKFSKVELVNTNKTDKYDD